MMVRKFKYTIVIFAIFQVYKLKIRVSHSSRKRIGMFVRSLMISRYILHGISIRQLMLLE